MVRPDKIIREFEGLRLDAYQDQGGVWTIGYGHTGPDVQPGLTITKQEADRLLREDIAWAERLFDETVTASVNAKIRAACVSLIFNIGPGAWRGSTALRRLNAGDYAGAAEALVWWNKVTIDGRKVRSNGLVRRREAERALFMQGAAGLDDGAAPSEAPVPRGKVEGGEQKPLSQSKTAIASMTGIAGSGAGVVQAFAYIDWRVAIPLILVAGVLGFIFVNRWLEARKGEH